MQLLLQTTMAALAIGVIMLGRPVQVQPAELAVRISIFKDLIEAIGAAGDSLKKITDGFKHLIESGVAGYDAAAARLTYSDLKEVSKAATVLAGSQTQVVDPIDSYLDNPSPTGWDDLRQRFTSVLLTVNALLERVKRNQSDFILEPAYKKLHTALVARASLLTKLQDLPPPTTQEELALLRQARDRYSRLLRELNAAHDQLNEYLKQHPPP